MKIVILSDTHFKGNFKLCPQLETDLKNSDAVIHCGDFESRRFYEYLNSNFSLFCARGNTDVNLPDSVRPLEKFKLKDYTFIVTHGHLYNPEYLHLQFPEANIICYGHTHHPEITKDDEKKQLVINPGSYNFNRYVDFNSYLKLELSEDFKDIKLEQIKFSRFD